ncbi:GNAT family N-acetyltransferase [Novosphingobium sp.]|uniref:GNAT family N-acetyltransferase n=1 Tax=Novosphingobium sp. TaxID=1874826 RepID=UPI00286B59C5|nr:GNAT family N-acetyltransferase [Novosphingobium sp.]
MRIEERDPADPAALACLAQYYAELDARFAGGFKVALSADPDTADLVRPRGCFLVAFDGDTPVGCAALKGTDKGYGEVKRMWIAGNTRGTGLARHLMERIETVARELGMTLLRLDTNRALADAIAIYRHWGWREISRFNDDPYAEVFFERSL